ncbi:MAG: class III signal peptide-containing protein [Candidatus Micrarchaeota archaeon]|nr:class III signal peptide-containing protein [Candidatus Micrarchaeota archaeon]
MKKAQVSSEFLIILGAVLVIAMVVAYLAGGFTSMSSGSTEQLSKAYWVTATPFSITAYKATGSSLTMNLINKDSDDLQITGVYVNDVLTFNTPTDVISGEQKLLTIDTGKVCSNVFSYKIKFVYTKGVFTGQYEVGEKPLIGKCA